MKKGQLVLVTEGKWEGEVVEVIRNTKARTTICELYDHKVEIFTAILKPVK